MVGVADELTGQAVNAFVSLKDRDQNSEQLLKDLVLQVRRSIGPFATPKAVFIVNDLPKTRSGKIMRRILRKILSGEEDSLGDISTVSYMLNDATFFFHLCFRILMLFLLCSSHILVSFKKSSILSMLLKRNNGMKIRGYRTVMDVIHTYIYYAYCNCDSGLGGID